MTWRGPYWDYWSTQKSLLIHETFNQELNQSSQEASISERFELGIFWLFSQIIKRGIIILNWRKWNCSALNSWQKKWVLGVSFSSTTMYTFRTSSTLPLLLHAPNLFLLITETNPFTFQSRESFLVSLQVRFFVSGSIGILFFLLSLLIIDCFCFYTFCRSAILGISSDGWLISYL